MTMIDSIQNDSYIHCNTPSTKTFTPLAYIDSVTLFSKDINNTKRQRKAPLAISKDVTLARNNEKGISKH
jgi:hypothetical protein